jgi:lipopolysaccharide/colanic/teichoic acid biosynthesis glycosyltransferase
MSRAYEITKRIIDVLASTLVLLVSAPICLVIAGLIKLDSSGPVLYVQQAVGKDGREFVLCKFRTMRVGSNNTNHRRAVIENMKERKPTGHDKQGWPIFKTSLIDEQSVTRVGRYLRRISLDEFPQFWNVVRGEMSLVGPRPALPYEAILYTEQQRERFQVRPGITGLYQVTARSRVPIEEMIRIDLQYIQRRSLACDLWIIARTPGAMLRGV